MKRVGNLFEPIADRSNLQLAVWKASKGHRHRGEAKEYLGRLDAELNDLSRGLRDGTFPVGRYQQFTIRDPKERIITAPCFRERVLHHAVMNVCEPHFERWLIADTFACRTGKGRTFALERAAGFARSHGWFLSMDVRKYFDSISQPILMGLLERRFKDRRLLELLGRIVSSYRPALGCGLLIGSLVSQNLANFYLDRFDRFVKETLRMRGYVRYMDDTAIWSHNRAELADVLDRAKSFLADELGLIVKASPVLNRTAHGMDFLGVRQFPHHRILNRRSRVRFRRRLHSLQTQFLDGSLTESELQQRLTSLTAFASGDGVCSWQFRRSVLCRSRVGDPMARTE